MVVVGGGYTGLWTAYYLLRDQPGREVLVLEAEHVGFGASGRNGGWVSALWPVGPDTLDRRYGRTATLAQLAALRDTVDEVGRVDAEEGLGAGFVKGGALVVARTPAQEARARVAAAHSAVVGRRHGLAGCRRHPRAARRRRRPAAPPSPPTAPACTRAGWSTAWPAAVRRLGGRIVEGAHVARIRDRVVVLADGHRISAANVVVATEGWTGTLSGLSRRVAPVYSLMVATEPIDDERWARIGLAGREVFADHGHVVIYGQRTDDGRIAFGGRGAPYHWGSEIRPEFDEEPTVFDALRTTLRDLLPQLDGIRVHARVGRPARHRPRLAPVGDLGPGDPGRPGGWLRRRRRGGEQPGRPHPGRPRARAATPPLTALPWVGHRSPRWEHEPLRWVGINAGLQLAGLADREEEATGRPARLGALLDRLTAPLTHCAVSAQTVARATTSALTAGRFPLVREIESLPALHAALGSGGSLAGLRLQDLDLTGHEDALLARTDLEGMVVLGGRIPHALDAHLRAHGALVFPTDPGAPVNPYRSTLYQPRELYAGLAEHGYDATPDARAYHWARTADDQHDAFVTLLRAIHDDSITDALHEFVDGVPTVGVMGGHALERDTARYLGAALLGHRLATAGLAVVTGGGPGAMEAANLGAFAPTRRPSRMPCGGCPRCPPSGPTSAPGPRSRWPCTTSSSRRRPGRGGDQHRHPDVVLRARAAQRLLQRHREVLLERAARGRPARPVDRRARRARGRRRHRAGDLPGGHAAVLLARGRHAAGGRARRARALDADGAGLAGPDRAGVGAGDGRAPAPGRLGRRGGRGRDRGPPFVKWSSAVLGATRNSSGKTQRPRNPVNRTFVDLRGLDSGLPLQGLR